VGFLQEWPSRFVSLANDLPCVSHRGHRVSFYQATTVMTMLAQIENRAFLSQVRTADTFLQSFLGLMGKPRLPAGEGLLIKNCSSIHMFFMRFAIDAIFLDADDRIVKIYHGLRPWRIVFGGKGARHVLEVPAGTCKGFVARLEKTETKDLHTGLPIRGASSESSSTDHGVRSIPNEGMIGLHLRFIPKK